MRILPAFGRTSGQMALDKISVALLADDDAALVFDQGKIYFYILDPSLGGDGDGLYSIKPFDADLAAVPELQTKRWRLTGITNNNSDFTVTEAFSIFARTITGIDNELSIENSDGKGLKLGEELIIDAETSFSSPVSGVDGDSPGHFVTKGFIEELLEDTDPLPLYGKEALSSGATGLTISFSSPRPDTLYNVYTSLTTTSNDPSVYGLSVYDKTVNGFKVVFSGPIEDTTYSLEWMIKV